jgi:hypothetical protein
MTYKQGDQPPKPATGSQLHKLVTSYRRRGMTATFGMDVDPKVQQK